jgi:hypothetical protein
VNEAKDVDDEDDDGVAFNIVDAVVVTVLVVPTVPAEFELESFKNGEILILLEDDNGGFEFDAFIFQLS